MVSFAANSTDRIPADTAGHAILEAMIEYASDGIVLTDEAGVIILWNPSQTRMTGLAQSDVLGKYIWEVFIRLLPDVERTPEAIAYCWQRFQHCLKGDVADPLTGFYELPIQPLANDILNLEVTSFAIPTANGYMVGNICRDITGFEKAARVVADKVKEHSEELALTNWASNVFTATLNWEEVLPLIMREVRRLIHADGVCIWLVSEWPTCHGPYDEDSRRLRLEASTNEAGNPLPMHYAADFTRMAQWVLEKDQKLSVPDLRAEAPVARAKAYSGRSPIRSSLLVPLKTKGKAIGVLQVYAAEVGHFMPNDMLLLESLAIPAAIAILNARLFERVKEMTTTRERQRISQHLHDLINQSLSSVALIAEVLPQLWEQDPEKGLRALTELRESVHGALAEQRRALAELRSPDLTATGLAELLEELGDTFSRRANLPVEFIRNGRGEVPSDVQVTLYRICQEALNNISKHARASHVSIQLNYRVNAATLRIVDNGAGFDASLVPDGHYGLQIMQERAATIGAQLAIKSEPGKGTHVSVQWSGGA